MMTSRALSLVLCVAASAACGGSTPPPKTEEAPKEEAPKPTSSGGGGASVSQELGSIDQRAVEQTFAKLQGKLEGCQKRGRDRVEFLAGDVKVFLRVDGNGKVKYGYFEESSLGDRETEKCILDLFAAADWPKPQGGEAEIRNGFGWPAGSERPPASWGAEKVAVALENDKATKKSVDKCKAGVTGDFRVTAYVEPGEVERDDGAGHGAGKGTGKGGGKGGGKKKGHAKTEPKKGNPKGAGKNSEPEHGGKFKAIGVSVPSKEGAEKVECIVDALRGLSLPSPGSYAAKVTFPL